MTRTFALSQETLNQLGREAGFDAVGATTADPFPELRSYLQSYETRGRTGFESSDIEERVVPESWMNGARSLIAVAMAYLTEQGFDLARRDRMTRTEGRVTVYSFGDDYHRVMHERLKRLQRLIEEHVGHPIQAKPMVDTGPAVDRRVAERAGLGWMGKNCMFYHPQYGSFVFLGTLVVDIVVEPSLAELPSRCGDCEQCLIACPTGALLAPGVIDATRCLSYITQMKGMIPDPFREKLGKRVWGCDTCQWACPENARIDYADHDEYLPARELAVPQLLDVLQLSNREFRRRYGKTAASWRGLSTWQRNALIALGNARSRETVPHVAAFLQHPRPELRGSAAWALKRIDPTGTRHLVAAAHQVETDEAVRQEMAWSMAAGEPTSATSSW